MKKGFFQILVLVAFTSLTAFAEGPAIECQSIGRDGVEILGKYSLKEGTYKIDPVSSNFCERYRIDAVKYTCGELCSLHLTCADQARGDVLEFSCSDGICKDNDKREIRLWPGVTDTAQYTKGGTTAVLKLVPPCPTP